MADLHSIPTAPALADLIYQALLNAICDGSLPPGERITQDGLADKFQTSRQPVLQALRMLKTEGLVVDAPALTQGRARGQGLMVSLINSDWIAQVYQVRAALDALAAQLACRRSAMNASDVLSPTEAAVLVSAGRAAVRSKDMSKMIEADAAFHRRIYVASGNPLIAQSAQLHWHHIRRAMGAVLQSTGAREAVWDEHEAIAHAICTGSARKAEKLMSDHAQGASHHIVMALSKALTANDKPRRRA
jgi:DNA-binding GntR family transcriptional regulator